MTHSHFHDDFEIFFLLEGKRDIFIKDQTHTILPQSLVFISPKVIHKTIVRDTPYYKRYALMIPKEFVNTLALQYEGNLFECFQPNSPVFELTGEKYAHILRLFNRIYQEYEHDAFQKNFIISILVAELLYYLNRYRNDSQLAPANSESTLSSQVIEILTNRYAENIQLQDLSKQLYVSTFALCRLFKSQTGFTIMEYLLFVRLREAMRLLDTTENSVTDISLAVGFNSINHFIRAFKQHLFITPKQYQLKKKTAPTN